MPDPTFQSLFEATDALAWYPADVVGERARRRTRRTRVMAAAAFVLVVGAGIGGVAVARSTVTRPQPGTTPSGTAPTPPGTPSPTSTAPPPSSSTPPPAAEGTALVDALFLQPADVGTGYALSFGGEGSRDWTVEFSLSMLRCEFSGTITPPIVARDGGLVRNPGPNQQSVTQYVQRYAAGDAARYLDQLRARVSACRPPDGRSITVGAQHFAGQDSLLFEVNDGGGSAMHVLVRQGDLLTEFYAKPERSGAAMQALGRTAASRLCAATPAC